MLYSLHLSNGAFLFFGNIIGVHLILAKAIGDIILGCISYQVQNAWVFKEKSTESFYSGIINISRVFARLFSKKYRAAILPPKEPCIYVCRHLNMHGPYATLKWFPFGIHPMMLYPFLNRKDAYKHFPEYTFSEKRGKKKKKVSIKAFFSSIVTPIAAKGVSAIRVYRGSVALLKTFRQTVKGLECGENVIVFPDIDYMDSAEHESDIYDGFLAIGRFYKHKMEKSLDFVPIYIDEYAKTIYEHKAITIDDFKSEHKAAAIYIKNLINK